jgi:hypothetical protein
MRFIKSRGLKLNNNADIIYDSVLRFIFVLYFHERIRDEDVVLADAERPRRDNSYSQKSFEKLENRFDIHSLVSHDGLQRERVENQTVVARNGRGSKGWKIYARAHYQRPTCKNHCQTHDRSRYISSRRKL